MEPGIATSRRALLRVAGAGGAVLAASVLSAGAARAAAPPGSIVVGSGQTLTIPATTRTRLLVITDGGALAAPAGHSLSVTVNGIETGSVLPSTYARAPVIAPGPYRGDVVIAVAKENAQAFFGTLIYQLRQAVYVGANGIVPASSVLSAVRGHLGQGSARGISLRSAGEAFDGFYVAGGSYELIRPDIRFDGNGRCDFVGDGAAIVGDGKGTRLVVDGAVIDNRGAVRPGVVATNGANVIVKNSRISTRDGVLPADYTFGLGPNMMSVPWMLGLSGNVRATVALGKDTIASYVNSSISSANWGVLSTDSDTEAELTAINCDLAITGQEGYGSYADGSAIDRFLGCRFRHVAYAAISTGGSVYFGDSTPQAVAALNTSQDIRLTSAELAAIPSASTVIDSTRFGVMWAQGNGGSVTIDGGTILSTAETTFLVKAVKATIAVDGAQGARLRSGTGVLLQLMETDDPGSATGVYAEPTISVAKEATFDTAAKHGGDVVAGFSDIELNGDFYNGRRAAQNLILDFTRVRVRGVISASVTRHVVSSIGAAEYRQLGRVTNTAKPAVNNGVILTLGRGSTWTVSGVSHLTSLTVESGAAIVGATVTVNGAVTAVVPGTTYTGAILVTPS